MFIPSDPWIIIPGNFGQTTRDPSSLFYGGDLSGLSLGNSHVLGLQDWYWAQGLDFTQAQRDMAGDQWMADPGVAETHGSYMMLEEPAPDRHTNSGPRARPAQTHYDYIQPLFESSFWSRAPYPPEAQLLTPSRGHAALPYAAPAGPVHHGPASYTQSYMSPWGQAHEAVGCYRMDLGEQGVKRETHASGPALPSPRLCCAEQWTSTSPGDLRFAPSLSPDLDAPCPRPSPPTAAPPATPETARSQRSSPASSPRTPPRRRRVRAPTPEVPRQGDRGAMDEFLVRSRLAGKSYREIRRLGGFVEAESTLRGRFRALTKRKEERVRRPEWSDVDIALLRTAVRKLSKGHGPSWLKKIAWKEVSEYIANNGGTYRFGNATCRKKWDELSGVGRF